MAEHRVPSIAASPEMLYKNVPYSKERSQKTTLESDRIEKYSASYTDRRLVLKIYKQLQAFLEGG